MTKYIRLPETVDAFKWEGSAEDLRKWMEEVGAVDYADSVSYGSDGVAEWVEVYTPFSVVGVEKGDWLVYNPEHGFNVYGEREFRAKYQPILPLEEPLFTDIEEELEDEDPVCRRCGPTELVKKMGGYICVKCRVIVKH